MFFFNIFLVLLPAAVAVPLPYVILPHASATTVSTTPASTAVTSMYVLMCICCIPLS